MLLISKTQLFFLSWRLILIIESPFIAKTIVKLKQKFNFINYREINSKTFCNEITFRSKNLYVII